MPSNDLSTTSTISTDLQLPPNFPRQLRQLSHHLTAVQARSQILPPHPHTPTRFDGSELQPSADIAFRPALLAANVHRFIISVLPIYVTASTELTRLREWHEPRRTAIWAITYAFLWSLHALLPTALAISLAFVLAPTPTASFLFPPPVDKPKEDHTEPTEPALVPELAHSMPDPDLPTGDADAQAALIAGLTAAAASSECPDIVLVEPSPVSEPPTVVPEMPQVPKPRPSPPSSQTAFLPPKYRPHIDKYAGGVQRVAAELADVHERLRNLFHGRYVRPPIISHSPSSSGEPNRWLAPNERLACTLAPLILLSLVLSTQQLAQLGTFFLGLFLFVLAPFMARISWLAAVLDPEQGLLRDVPTDRAFLLAELRKLKREGGLRALAGALRFLEPEEEEESRGSEVASVRSSSSSGSSGRPSTRLRLVGAARRVQRAAEIGTGLLNGQRTFTIDFSRLGRSIGAAKEEERGSNKSTTPPPLSPHRLATTAKAKSSRQSAVSDDDAELGRFGCCYGSLPGELRIESDYVTFDSGIGFLSSSLRKDGGSVRLRTRDIVGIRKMSGVGITGLWGGIDGLELVAEIAEGGRTEEVKRKVYRFWNVSRRDLAFVWMVVMRDWSDDEDLDRSGWIAV